MIKTRPNNSIIFHWIVVAVLIIILIIKIHVNVFGFLTLIGLLILTLAINRTTFLYFENKTLTIVKKNFLIVPTYTRKINLSLVEIIEIEEFKNESFFPNTGGIIVSFFTGFLFYLPRYKLIIDSNQKLNEIEINTGRKEFKALELKLGNILKKKLKHRKNHSSK